MLPPNFVLKLSKVSLIQLVFSLECTLVSPGTNPMPSPNPEQWFPGFNHDSDVELGWGHLA
jgi:hypothetical protein